ncbi:peptidylprolyl isomerase [Jejudonia soesokkakensis]|uniref:Periplasmic chaperone PpiD n=1 Tax=Jejudonia soesokkakensis TaxID=1323432 RepID=A0ABW2MZB6_9FLAO
MAVLNKIRQRSVFLIIIIALALFSFVLADVIRNGGFSSSKSQTTVATVNGKDIPRQEFAEKVDAYQRQVGPNVSSTQAMNTVWEQQLRTTLLSEQYEALGLTVENDELNDALNLGLADNPTFQDENGFYSEAKLQEYVASIKSNPTLYSQWTTYINDIKNGILETKYMNMVKGGLVSTLAEGEQQYRFENDKINIEYVYMPYASVTDDEVPVTDAEIQKYIKDHPKEFEVDSQVDIQYVSFSEAPSEEDITEAENNLAALLAPSKNEFGEDVPAFSSVENNEEYVNANSDQQYVDRWTYTKNLTAPLKDTISGMNSGDIYGPYKVDNTYRLSKVVATRQLPDSVKSRHILIPVGLNPTDSISRTDAQAKKTADSILAIVKRNNSKFPELVTAMSSDKGSVENGGRYDWYTYNTMVAPFRDFTFEGKTGDIGIAKTQFGYHIIEIEGQKNQQRVAKIATIVKEVEASEATLNETFSKAANFEVAAKKNWDDALASQDLQAKPVNKIGELDANIPGIGQNRRIVNWAFDEDTEVGDVTKEKTDTGYVVVQLTRKSEKGLMSVADASAKVTPILRDKKKAEILRNKATGTTLQEVATSVGVSVQNATALTMAAPTIPGAGTEPAVVGAAFGTEEGQETGYINGKKGVYKVRVLKKTPAPELQNYASFAKEANDAVIPQMNNNVYQALKKSAKIEDNRATFY